MVIGSTVTPVKFLNLLSSRKTCYPVEEMSVLIYKKKKKKKNE